MASRKSIHIYISKHVTAVKNCIIFFRSLLIKDTSLLTCSYIGELRHARKFRCENKPFIIFILFLEGFCFRFDFVLLSIRTYSRWDEFDLNTVSDGR